MRLLISLALTLFFMGSVAAEVPIATDKEVISFPSKLGTVTFRHKAHSDMTTTECSTCHHTYAAGDPAVKACGDCHIKKSKTAPSKMKAFHLRCQGCHQYTVDQGLKAGPVKKQCKTCHVKE